MILYMLYLIIRLRVNLFDQGRGLRRAGGRSDGRAAKAKPQSSEIVACSSIVACII